MSSDLDFEESEFPKMESQTHEYPLAKGLETAVDVTPSHVVR